MKYLILGLAFLTFNLQAQECYKPEDHVGLNSVESMGRMLSSIMEAGTDNGTFLDDHTAKELGMTNASEDNPPSYKVTVTPDEAKELSNVVIYIDKSPKGKSATAQKMLVFVDGQLHHEFDVTTGSEKVKKSTSGRTYFTKTPTGVYRPDRMFEEYESATWAGATMNNSIFFAPGIAIHATTPNHFDELGGRGSGGCVRLHPDDAKTLFDVVLDHGVGNAKRVDNKDESHHSTFKEGLFVNRHKVQFDTNSYDSENPEAKVDGVGKTGTKTGYSTSDFDTTIVIANFANNEYDGAPCLVNKNVKCDLDRSAYGK